MFVCFSFRVFKKGSPNGKITVYLGRHDFVDHITHIDPINGIVLVYPEYLNGQKVFLPLRYSRSTQTNPLIGSICVM